MTPPLQAGQRVGRRGAETGDIPWLTGPQEPDHRAVENRRNSRRPHVDGLVRTTRMSVVIRNRYSNQVSVKLTVTVTIPSYGIGVYRHFFTASIAARANR